MAPETVSAILDKVAALWPQANDLEVTLEANPSSVEAGRFRGFHQAGVNRISMGIQALNDNDLKRLGRIHSVQEAFDAFDIARTEFERVSFDLIYARQDQTLEHWSKELRQALSMAIDHLSLYQLTIEQGTAFGDRYNRGGLRGLPSDDTAADMYLATQDICAEFDMPAYEVSNHAKIGSESRHNLIYWRYGDYVGIGPGAHGRVTMGGQKFATENHLQPKAWLDAVANGSGESLCDPITASDQGAEYLLMGMRINAGVSLSRYVEITGQALSESVLSELIDLGMIDVLGDQLKTTVTGRPVLNAILDRLLVDQ